MKAVYLLVFLLFYAWEHPATHAIDVATIAANGFHNDRVRRVVDLTSSVVKEKITLKATNMGGKPMDRYYFTIPSAYKDHIAYHQAYHLPYGLSNEDLAITYIGIDSKVGLHVFAVQLDKPVNSAEQLKIGINLSYVHFIGPFPAKIPQLSKQHVTFIGTIFLVSPYETSEIKSTFKFPSNRVDSNLLEGVSYDSKVVGNTIIYGTFKDVPPFTKARGSFHYEYLKPMVTITRLERHMEVSHWGGNMGVEEHYDLQNDGADLNSIPKDATDIYYRDEVGNVSTSHFRKEITKSYLQIQPRFPVYGGWRSSWYMGHNVPLRQFLRHDSKADRKYILKVNLVDNVKEKTINDIEFKVTLPEGATDIELSVPPHIEFDSIEKTMHFTYFDSVGRPTIVFRKTYVVSDHEVPIFISYNYSTLRLLQKPLVTSSAIFFLFLLSICASKFLWTVTSDIAKVSDTVTQPSNEKQQVFTESKTLQSLSTNSVGLNATIKKRKQQKKKK
ncbi:Ribophorin I [Mycotypha africana]|uniref:Ribophorin I n=1 Tax=Mycotypha africana TaxID=64632 RepID=UPI002301F2C8|nr:Ribophorin I [Mycotypha africana]KAI8979782.1 Ribophorin I [Mycotypha africana]